MAYAVPKHTSETQNSNEYLAGWASRPFFPKKVSKFGFGDGNNVYEMWGSNTIFSKDPRYVGGKMEKRYVKKRETTLVHAHFFP